MVSLRRMGTIITQLEAERLGALDAPRGDDVAVAETEDAAGAVPEQARPVQPPSATAC